eukprot:TRINITY_DN1939_c2_g1_i1.p2 TRINITY_DN1939_c2_g1~~TRINITY_DN1939_c2_g1_i1.p2  ORF type:complete len:113 (+),score=19.40 TRINITY_DN1939_c2_g1_i1:160-498(+)
MMLHVASPYGFQACLADAEESGSASDLVRAAMENARVLLLSGTVKQPALHHNMSDCQPQYLRWQRIYVSADAQAALLWLCLGQQAAKDFETLASSSCHPEAHAREVNSSPES